MVLVCLFACSVAEGWYDLYQEMGCCFTSPRDRAKKTLVLAGR
jgi:hypothetical protein